MKYKIEFYKNLLDNMYEGIYFVDIDKKITYWNKGSERITGYTDAEVLGSRCQDNILIHVDEQGCNLCEESCLADRSIIDGKTYEVEVYLHHKNGHRVPVLVRTSPIFDDGGQIIGAVEMFSDNSLSVINKQRIQDLEVIAMYDQLTGLVNRRFCEMNIISRLGEMLRYNLRFGLLSIDVDFFKKINDTYGHDAGDRVLKMVAETMKNSVRVVDAVGRWGGEEFIAIIVNVDEDQLYYVSKKLLRLVEQSSLALGDDVIRVTVSIGATSAKPDDTMDSLLKRADRLLYQSKFNGRNCISIG